MAIRIPSISNRDGYYPIQDNDDVMQIASSPRLNVPKINKKSSSSHISASLLTESIRSIESEKSSPMDGSDIESYDALTNTINPLLLMKLNDRQQSVTMLEITSDGVGVYKSMPLRDLLAYINNIATDIDNKYLHYLKTKSLKEMNSSILSPNVTGSAKGGIPISGRSTPALHQLDDDKDSTGSKDQKSTGAQYLRHRDLRRLEYNFSPLGEPTLFVRRHAVLLSLDPLRVVVMADRLILIVPDGMDTVLELFDKALNAWSDVDSLPFEERAYEGIFSTIITLHTEEYELFNQQTLNILSDYKNASIISIEKQEQLRHMKNKITSMMVKVSAYKNVIVQLLDEDHDMALMNLTRLKKKPGLYTVPLNFEILSAHEEIEVLLESYLVDYNYLESKLEYLKSQILTAEELVLLRLDNSRNQLLIADTVIAIIAMSIGFGSFIGSILGMNLKNHHEEDAHAFHVVTTFTVVGITALAVSILLLLRCLGIIPSEYLSLSFYQSQAAYTSNFAQQLKVNTAPPTMISPNISGYNNRQSFLKEDNL